MRDVDQSLCRAAAVAADRPLPGTRQLSGRFWPGSGCGSGSTRSSFWSSCSACCRYRESVVQLPAELLLHRGSDSSEYLLLCGAGGGIVPPRSPAGGTTRSAGCCLAWARSWRLFWPARASRARCGSSRSVVSQDAATSQRPELARWTWYSVPVPVLACRRPPLPNSRPDSFKSPAIADGGMMGAGPARCKLESLAVQSTVSAGTALMFRSIPRRARWRLLLTAISVAALLSLAQPAAAQLPAEARPARRATGSAFSRIWTATFAKR